MIEHRFGAAIRMNSFSHMSKCVRPIHQNANGAQPQGAHTLKTHKLFVYLYIRGTGWAISAGQTIFGSCTRFYISFWFYRLREQILGTIVSAKRFFAMIHLTTVRLICIASLTGCQDHFVDLKAPPIAPS